MKDIKLVIWDWNGTLLDDVDICVENFNQLIARQGLPPVTKEKFRSIYHHPVKDMYDEVGMHFSEQYTFSDLSRDWYEGYMKKSEGASLFSDAITLLSFFRTQAVRQVLCSALEHDALSIQTTQFGVTPFFDEISGHHDREAESKIARSVSVWKQMQTHADETVVIGDSYHDLELADKIGCACLLVDTGHQSLVMGKHPALDPPLHGRTAIFKNLSAVKDMWI